MILCNKQQAEELGVGGSVEKLANSGARSRATRQHHEERVRRVAGRCMIMHQSDGAHTTMW